MPLARLRGEGAGPSPFAINYPRVRSRTRFDDVADRLPSIAVELHQRRSCLMGRKSVGPVLMAMPGSATGLWKFSTTPPAA